MEQAGAEGSVLGQGHSAEHEAIAGLYREAGEHTCQLHPPGTATDQKEDNQEPSQRVCPQVAPFLATHKGVGANNQNFKWLRHLGIYNNPKQTDILQAPLHPHD